MRNGHLWANVIAAALVVLPVSALAVETVRISMGETADTVVISGQQLCWGKDADEAQDTCLGKDRVTVRRIDGRLELEGEGVPEGVLRLQARGTDGGVGRSQVIALSTGPKVRGAVVVRLFQSGLQLINVIPLEEYLLAVLGSEMPPSFPVEALKAQAVAARTYALSKKLDGYDQPFHLGSSVLHQVYGGVRSETERTREAVLKTRGEVMTFSLAPIEAYFSASCGGRTETGLEALGRDRPYLKSVSCPCRDLPASRWQATFPLKDLGEGASELEVVSRSPSGRARRVRLGQNRVMDAVTFRQRLGYGRLKSLDFEVMPAPGGVRLSGHGFGHGAGLCQWGAKALAEEGWDYRRILEHYYAGAELQTLY